MTIIPLHFPSFLLIQTKKLYKTRVTVIGSVVSWKKKYPYEKVKKYKKKLIFYGRLIIDT